MDELRLRLVCRGQEGVDLVRLIGGDRSLWQLGQQEIEDVVVGAEAEDHPEYLALPEEITEGGLLCLSPVRSESCLAM